MKKTELTTSNYMVCAELRNNFVTPQQLIEKVCKGMNISEIELKKKGRKREFVIPRQCLMKIIFENYKGYSLEKIGALLSIEGEPPFDHATVLHSKTTISDALDVHDHIIGPVWETISEIVKVDLINNKLNHPDKTK